MSDRCIGVGAGERDCFFISTKFVLIESIPLSILLAGSRAQGKKCKAEAKGKRQRDAESDPWKGEEGEI